MPPSTPFIDPWARTLDIGHIVAETIPLGKRIAVFTLIALLPFAFTTVFRDIDQVVLTGPCEKEAESWVLQLGCREAQHPTMSVLVKLCPIESTDNVAIIP